MGWFLTDEMIAALKHGYPENIEDAAQIREYVTTNLNVLDWLDPSAKQTDIDLWLGVRNLEGTFEVYTKETSSPSNLAGRWPSVLMILAKLLNLSTLTNVNFSRQFRTASTSLTSHYIQKPDRETPKLVKSNIRAIHNLNAETPALGFLQKISVIADGFLHNPHLSIEDILHTIDGVLPQLEHVDDFTLRHKHLAERWPNIDDYYVSTPTATPRIAFKTNKTIVYPPLPGLEPGTVHNGVFAYNGAITTTVTITGVTVKTWNKNRPLITSLLVNNPDLTDDVINEIL